MGGSRAQSLLSVEEVERNLSVVFELRSVRSIYALERSEELRPIRPSKVNARVWKLGQSRDKPYGRDNHASKNSLHDAFHTRFYTHCKSTDLTTSFASSYSMLHRLVLNQLKQQRISRRYEAQAKVQTAKDSR
jgi:hypothetical protein